MGATTKKYQQCLKVSTSMCHMVFCNLCLWQFLDKYYCCFSELTHQKENITKVKLKTYKWIVDISIFLVYANAHILKNSEICYMLIFMLSCRLLILFKINLFGTKNSGISGIPSDWQTVWIWQIRPNVMLVLIWVQTVMQRISADDTSRQRVNAWLNYLVSASDTI